MRAPEKKASSERQRDITTTQLAQEAEAQEEQMQNEQMMNMAEKAVAPVANNLSKPQQQ